MEERNLIFLGDIHGNFKKVIMRMKQMKIENSDIIQVGDFGVGFYSFERDLIDLTWFNEYLKKTNCTITAFRGNHDKPSLFNDDPFKLSNIKLVSDYSVLELCNRKTLVIGGAISVDRKIRTQKDYFNDEQFVLDIEKINKLDLSEVEIICTHSAPNFVFPFEFNTFVYDYANIDAGLLTDLERERSQITEMFVLLKSKTPKLSHYFYGHFHSSWFCNIDNVNFRLLNIDEFYELRK